MKFIYLSRLCLKTLFTVILTAIAVFFFNEKSCSQDTENLDSTEINAGDYRVFLSNNNSRFFTGCIRIADKNNNTVLSADSIYSRYNWDTLIDLNRDGRKELILDLGTGANMYDYNMFLIFDLSRKDMEPVEIHNAELHAGVDAVPKIISYVRLSPAVMGAGYTYSMKYENGNLVLETDTRTSRVLKSLEPDGKDDMYLIDEYVGGFDPCAEDSQVMVYFEAIVTQWKLLGQEEKGWKFFDKYYKCKNKEKVRGNLKKIVDETYSYMKDSNNYKFNSN